MITSMDFMCFSSSGIFNEKVRWLYDRMGETRRDVWVGGWGVAETNTNFYFGLRRLLTKRTEWCPSRDPLKSVVYKLCPVVCHRHPVDGSRPSSGRTGPRHLREGGRRKSRSFRIGRRVKSRVEEFSITPPTDTLL